MKYLPFENYTLSSPLSTDEVYQRLLDNLAPTREYTGTLTTDSFAIHRVIGYRNSFLPNITGHFTPNPSAGTTIVIKMQVSLIVKIFMTIWFAGIGLANIAAFSSRPIPMAATIPVLMLLFGYGLMLGAFKYESSQSKKFLATLFKAN